MRNEEKYRFYTYVLRYAFSKCERYVEHMHLQGTIIKAERFVYLNNEIQYEQENKNKIINK